MAEKPTYKELENRVNELMVQRSHFAKVEAELNRSIRFTKSVRHTNRCKSLGI